MTIDLRRLQFLGTLQAGVYRRAQLLECAVTDNDIERMVRRRELVSVARGIYVTHTGPLTPEQRAWVAVFTAWPAALSHESALPGRPPPVIHLAVSAHRQITVPKCVVLHRMADLDDRVDWRAAPPRVKPEHAVIDVMSTRICRDDVGGAFAILAEVCHRRLTPARIDRVLARRQRVRGRRLIEDLLADLRTGAHSVIERGYLLNVERAHGLPVGRRQFVSSATGSTTVQDVRYDDLGLVVELDGWSVHGSSNAWNADARRDLAELAASDARTARVTHGMVYGAEACRTARAIATILRRLGWSGDLARCPRCQDL